jgi:hypothetical protein
MMRKITHFGQRYRSRAIFIIILSSFVWFFLGCELGPSAQDPFDPYRDLSAGLSVFPGAQGFGSDTPAGRGGKLIRVTNLNPSGPGSLSEALSFPGARTVVFEVGGIIELENNLEVIHPFLTLAGQTAPEPGITLVGAGLVVRTHDVLIQHIRVRPGDRPDGEDPENRDGISVIGDPRGETSVYNVVIDHCSVSWAIDEGMSTWYPGVSDVTFSNNIIAENLSESLHPKGEHSKGLLIGDHSRRISVLRNIFSHNMRRNPLLKGNTSSFVANNLVYNGGTQGIGFSDPEGSGVSIASIIGNVFIPGADTAGDQYVWRGRETSDGIEITLNDNLTGDSGLSPFNPPANIREVIVTDLPVDIVPLTLIPASILEGELSASAGAFPAYRDSVDRRIIHDLANRSGSIIDSQDEVGGYPAPTPTSRLLSPPENPGGDDDGDGYTNLEHWLHEYARMAEGR